MKRTVSIGNIKAFSQDGTELGKVEKVTAVVQGKTGLDKWLVTVKNK